MNLGEVITVGDDWYKVVRKVREDRQWDTELLKQHWFCTHTFRKDSVLYFCREIQKAQYEEVKT